MSSNELHEWITNSLGAIVRCGRSFDNLIELSLRSNLTSPKESGPTQLPD